MRNATDGADQARSDEVRIVSESGTEVVELVSSKRMGLACRCEVTRLGMGCLGGLVRWDATRLVRVRGNGSACRMGSKWFGVGCQWGTGQTDEVSQ